MLKIPWTDHVSNEQVLEMAGNERTLMKRIRTGQAKFLGHVMRKGGLEHLAVTGKIEGNRGQGRRRQTYTVALSKCLGVESIQLLRSTQNRSQYKSMAAHAIQHGT